MMMPVCGHSKHAMYPPHRHAEAYQTTVEKERRPQSPRDRQHHRRSVRGVVIGYIQNQEYQDHDGGEDAKRIARAPVLGVRPFRYVRRKIDTRIDNAAGLFHKPHDIAPAHVQLHIRPQKPVFALPATGLGTT
jgi:hypothetical protein